MAGLNTETARAEGEMHECLSNGRQVEGFFGGGKAFLFHLSGPVQRLRREHHPAVRGMRAHTLAQRVSCWRPFCRYLLQRGLPPAPRTAIPSLLAFLSFLEQASEQLEQQRLSNHPALRNASKEKASGLGNHELPDFEFDGSLTESLNL